MNHLTSLFGMLDDNVAEDFEAVDENRDGVVSKQESKDAFSKGKDRTFKMKTDRLVVSGRVVSRHVVSLTFGLLDTWTFGHLVFGTNELLDIWPF